MSFDEVIGGLVVVLLAIGVLALCGAAGRLGRRRDPGAVVTADSRAEADPEREPD